MTKHEQLMADARRAFRAARTARRRANEQLIKLEFPSRPRPLYVALDFHDGFSIVETDDNGELRGVVIPFKKASRS
jgi:hypothetical protein